MPKENILVAEDEPFVRDICVRALREDGYQVYAVASGAQAVEAARGQTFDLFLTDLRMPGMSGLDAYKAVREFTTEIIGVAMTGYATMEAAIQALQLGFHDFILKPFLPQDVRNAVARALEQRRLREENARLRTLIPFYQLTHAFMNITALDDLLHKAMNVAIQETGVDTVAALLFDELGRGLVVKAAVGLPGEAVGSKVPVSEGSPVSRSLEAGQPLIWTDELASFFPFAADISALITVPLITQGQTLGLMVVGKRPPASTFTYGDMELLSVLAAQAATAIKNAQLFQEIQQAYKNVEESDYLKSEFMAIASHELRTPLASILGYVEILAYEAKKETAEYLNIVLEQALRLRDIVNDLLSLTDLKAGMTEIVWDRIPLEATIAKVVEPLRTEMEAKRLSLSTVIPEDCATIHADYERLCLILSKLLSNAVKFSPQGEKIIIGAKTDQSKAVISVTDRGPGISPVAQQNLFRPFYQVEESLRRTHSGMGLGLAIAKGMVELHGGEIWVESELGKGSTFAFSIPQPAQV